MLRWEQSLLHLVDPRNCRYSPVLGSHDNEKRTVLGTHSQVLKSQESSKGNFRPRVENSQRFWFLALTAGRAASPRHPVCITCFSDQECFKQFHHWSGRKRRGWQQARQHQEPQKVLTPVTRTLLWITNGNAGKPLDTSRFTFSDNRSHWYPLIILLSYWSKFSDSKKSQRRRLQGAGAPNETNRIDQELHLEFVRTKKQQRHPWPAVDSCRTCRKKWCSVFPGKNPRVLRIFRHQNCRNIVRKNMKKP